MKGQGDPHVFKTVVHRAISDRVQAPKSSPERRLGPELTEKRREAEERLSSGLGADVSPAVRLLDPIFRNLRRGLRALGLYERLARRATRTLVVERRYEFLELPPALEGFRILQLSDLHIDGHRGFAEQLARQLDGLEVDLVVLTGDYRFEVQGPHEASVAGLRHAIQGVRDRFGRFAVLGNHDPLAMVRPLEDLGVQVLLNEGEEIEVGDGLLYVGGCDDPAFFETDDVHRALAGAPADAFRLFLSHGPEAAEAASREGVDLFLCGHTHGGQVNPWPGVPLITNSSAPRERCGGEWELGAMIGYTSSGVGFSGLPWRSFTRSEAVIHELHSIN
jgi:uncharacterized protein